MTDKYSLQVVPFNLPLDRAAFTTALHRGQGRALMHVLQEGPTGFEDLILDACRHNRLYDRQCEFGRESWLIRIVEAAGLEQAVNDIVVQHLSPRPDGEHTYDDYQLAGLAMELAKRGFEDSRKSLYAAFVKRDSFYDMLGAEEIVKLDGAAGLLYVAQKFGEWLAEDSTFEIEDQILDEYDEMHGKGSGLLVVEESAKTNTAVARYVEHLKRDEEERKRMPTNAQEEQVARRAKVAEITPDQVVENMGRPVTQFGRYWFVTWGRATTEENLRIIMERMFAETDDAKLLKYLSVFSHRALPKFDDRILKYADHPNRDVRWRTYHVLDENVHEKVRELAISRIRANRVSEGELTMLQRNFQPGDWSIIKELVTLPDDDFSRHTFLLDLLNTFEANFSAESVEPMLAIYEYSPCSMCRENAMEVLTKLDAVPNWIANEWTFDACSMEQKYRWKSEKKATG